MEDGARDYPINVDGRQTLTGYQLRVWGAGNIVASPKDEDKLYLVFSDNRNGVHDSDNPVTNTDVFIVKSSDGGRNWTYPSQVDKGKGDQWFPWADVNPVNGKVGVLYHDRGNWNGPTYNTELAQGQPGSFSRTIVNTEPSEPDAVGVLPGRRRRDASSAPSSTATTSGSPTAATATRTRRGRTCAIRPRSRPGCSCSSSTTRASKALEDGAAR